MDSVIVCVCVSVYVKQHSHHSTQPFQIYSMTLRLEAYFEDQIKSVLSSHKSKGKRNPSKATPRPAKRKAAPPVSKVSSGRAGPSQPSASSLKASAALPSTESSRRLPAPPPPPPAPSKKGPGPSKTTTLTRLTGLSRPTASCPKSTWGC